jgi:hypothetical protein
VTHNTFSPERKKLKCLLPMEANPTEKLGVRDRSLEFVFWRGKVQYCY